MSMFSYPLDSSDILKFKKKYKKKLLSDGVARIKKNIAVLGGSTTNDIVDILELFLLDEGIEPCFYQSEYAMYWQDVVFDNKALDDFAPDIVFIHTTTRNIERYFPTVRNTADECEDLLKQAQSHFLELWQRISEKYHCTIIQNNFEMPRFRLLGNKDGADIHGATYFVRRMNTFVSEYAINNSHFYLNDIDYVSSCYGIDKWSDSSFWYMYKYAMCLDAIPEFSFNLSRIIKSIFGKNKKSLVLDMDNTLWGGVVGDDGVNNLELGTETPVAQAYTEFQSYVKKQKDLGVMLNICSKNDEANAIAGLDHPNSLLKFDDFIVFKANWEPKNLNIASIAKQLNITTDALVFVDDNPAEREIVRNTLPCAVPEVGDVDTYIKIMDRNGYFEVTSISQDDINRNEMYKANAAREVEQASFADYGEFLKNLKMHAEIASFAPIYIQRIAQLTNKSNQFNLTTRRYTPEEIEFVAKSDDYITLYGKLVDKFGDNGVVSLIIGKIEGKSLHIDLFIMSCRVLKRDMEFAMLDSLVAKCKELGIDEIIGFYYPTAKNSMVKTLYKTFGFTMLKEDDIGNTVWNLKLDGYTNQNNYIDVN